ncbi:MAG: type II toxin-antitoxin system VapC family toxin [Gemmatimonadetes bacterium]|nr:PIN domain-containing protein [Gemmatimonadota bacterium]MXX12803.1 type II toxin-antitoxin system VapC family toxin [Gemmatimonadota bacterium]MYB56421.1 type II toxin-antitoxin system VapC family toxin [Gemmatimonadota bacterium]MYC12424.1 type II toxin-antitoxin system VapC family toxin [Gemmatimonadota bacterium]MYD61869.1 type II toxin-antitoxin system VapC family toxin [Gemmatimonadota bacterium]
MKGILKLVILDTNIVSYIFNKDTRALYYQNQIRGRRVLISFQTLEELWYGAYTKGWGDRRKNELAHHLEQYEIIWPGPELVTTCARLRSERKSAGREMRESDAWIAATAIMLGYPLASHDHDFSDISDLELIQAPAPQPDQSQE